MNRDRIKVWVDALRSGEFKQGMNRLRNPGSRDVGVPDMFCCLGVACEVAIRGGVPIEFTDGSGYVQHEQENGFQYEGSLPPLVVDWLGLTGHDTEEAGDFVVGVEDGRRFLAQLNDTGWTFEQIADVIENEFLKEEK